MAEIGKETHPAFAFAIQQRHRLHAFLTEGAGGAAMTAQASRQPFYPRRQVELDKRCGLGLLVDVLLTGLERERFGKNRIKARFIRPPGSARHHSSGSGRGGHEPGADREERPRRVTKHGARHEGRAARCKCDQRSGRAQSHAKAALGRAVPGGQCRTARRRVIARRRESIAELFHGLAPHAARVAGAALAAAATAGMRMVTPEPTPYSERTLIAPPIISTKRRVSVRPSPVPP